MSTDYKLKNPHRLNGREFWIRPTCQIAQMIVTDGGIGDLIACLVAAKWNIDHAPGIIWRVFCPDFLEPLANHLLDGTHVVKFSEAKGLFFQDLPTRTTEWCNEHSAMRCHPVDYGFHMLADRHIYENKEKNYLKIRRKEINVSKFRLPHKYAVIGSTGVEPVKTLPGHVINEISDFLISNDITPVYLGKKNSHSGYKDFEIKAEESGADLSKGINLIDKTDLLEAAAIIDRSHAFIGMDGGLMHLSGCTDAPIVAGFTLVSPSQVAPIRNGTQNYKFYPVEPDLSIKNRYYQSSTNVFTAGDFRTFPGWQEVVDNLTSDKFIKQLEFLKKDSQLDLAI